jgi:hypothetical protein
MRAGKVVQKGYDRSKAPVYMTTGGGGDWVYESPGTPPAWSAVRLTEYHHLQLTLEGDALHVEAVRPDGTVFDQFTLTKDVPPPQPAPPAEGGQTPGGESPSPTPAPSPDGSSPQPRPEPPAPAPGEVSPAPGVPGDEGESLPTGGCSSLPGGLLAAPLVLVLAGLLRRGRRR